ncbi:MULTISPECIES: hypothetical protein [unclassified Streptomyces]|uniref:hypothetical protein n=1 Tax=unclassified Streptomyces TaxID=2593676 RepID=UPI00331B3077
MSTPPSYPDPRQLPGPYQQAPGPYQQPQAPGAYAQVPGAYAPASGPYAQPGVAQYAPVAAPGPYQQAPVPGPYQQPPQAQPYGGGMPVGGAMQACRLCGAGPAAQVTVRGHQGMLIVMRSLRRRATMCRPCALATFREMQANTMVQGWWGPMSLVITPITLLVNLGSLATIRRIPEPVVAGHRPPLNPGKSVFKRPQGILGLIPLCLVLGVVLLAVVGAAAG